MVVDGDGDGVGKGEGVDTLVRGFGGKGEERAGFEPVVWCSEKGTSRRRTGEKMFKAHGEVVLKSCEWNRRKGEGGLA